MEAACWKHTPGVSQSSVAFTWSEGQERALSQGLGEPRAALEASGQGICSQPALTLFSTMQSRLAPETSPSPPRLRLPLTLGLPPFLSQARSRGTGNGLGTSRTLSRRQRLAGPGGLWDSSWKSRAEPGESGSVQVKVVSTVPTGVVSGICVLEVMGRRQGKYQAGCELRFLAQ